MQRNTILNTYTSELNNFYVKSQKLAGYLMMRGFVLKGLKPDINNNTKRNTFIFNNTQELTNAINDYKQVRNN
jgi:hypothetical protein